MKTGLLLLGATFALSGCAELAALFPISDAVTADSGATYSGKAAYLVRNVPGDSVTLAPDAPFDVTLAKTAAGAMQATMTFNGNTVTFTEADLNVDGNEFAKTLANGTTVYLWNPAGTWRDIFDGNGATRYVAAFGASDWDGTVNNRITGVLGTPTTLIPTSGTATYNGDLYGEFYASNVANSRTVWSAHVGLNADFGAATPTIGGRITDNAFDGTIDPDDFIIDETQIQSDGTYRTTLSLDTANCVSCGTLDSSAVSGAFYGPDAVETGGTVKLSGDSDTSVPVVGHGSFVASK